MKSTVYMTSQLSGEGLVRVFEALGIKPAGRVAIKMHWGEPGNVNYLRPEIMRPFYETIAALPGVTDVAVVDCNVFYDSPRQTTEGSVAAALDHGYGCAKIDVLDSEGTVTKPISGGIHLSEAIFGSHIENYDWLISVAHFKGHEVAGFGGAFKNLAIGCAAVAGKEAIHTDYPGAFQWSSQGKFFIEKVMDYNKAIRQLKGEKMLYLNVLNNLSDLCDCNAEAPVSPIPDIGIVGSTDPVALDKASLDLVYAQDEKLRHALTHRIEECGGAYQIECAEKVGLGSSDYELVKLPDAKS
jgi:uncharacterized Fe-S center protein